MPKQVNYSELFSVYLNQHVEKGTSGEVKLDCPFEECLKEDHFRANCDNGLWHCLRCDAGGNNRALVTQLHAQYLKRTTLAQYQLLSRVRYIAVDILQEAGFAYDAEVDRWYVPFWYYDPEKKEFTDTLTNLGYFCPSLPNEKERYVIKKGKGFNTYLYNPGITYPATKIAIICEGEWDTLAYYDSHRDSDDLIQGKPGSGFPVQVMQGMAGCTEFHLLTDNDAPGQQQKVRAIGVIKQEAPTAIIKELDWSLVEDAPKDIRDLWKNPARRVTMSRDISNAMVVNEDAYDSIQALDPERIAPGHIADVYSCQPVFTFTDYIQRMKDAMMYITPINEMAIAAVHAITCTIGIRDQPLWAFLIGPPSCLDGDTIIKVNRAGKTFDISMKDLYYMSIGAVRGGKRWARSIPTRIQRRDSNGSIRLVDILQVVDSGVKNCFEVTTASGHTIVASKDHKFLTSSGWKTLKQLTLQDCLFVNNGNRGIIKDNNKNSKKQRYKYGLTYHPYRTQPCQGSRKKSRGRDRVLLHRLVYEAYMNDLSLEDFVEALKHQNTQNKYFKFLLPTELIHHIDGDHTNNRLENLYLTDVVGHGVIHGEENVSNVAERTDTSPIVSIVSVGQRHTYDLTVASDPHNFLANGIVVHNSGKTTMIDSYGGNNQWFDCLSKLSSESLVSGWSDDSDEEASYLPRLDNKTLFVKDFTVTLQETIEKQKKVMGLLTDIYDGFIKVHYGNRKLNEFVTYFNMIAGVTPIVYAHSSVSIGERFLRIDWLGKNYDRREYTRRAIMNFGEEAEVKKKELSEATLGFAQHLRAKELNKTIEPMYREPLVDLAEFVAIIRTKAELDRHEGLIYRPEAELGPRLGKQLSKMYVGSRHVLSGSEGAYAVTRKVAFDTCHGFALEMVEHILTEPNSTRESISRDLDLHPQRAYRVLTNLVTTNVLTKRDISSRSPGRSEHCFSINPALLPALEPQKYLDHDTYTNPKSPAYRKQRAASSVRRLPPPRS